MKPADKLREWVDRPVDEQGEAFDDDLAEAAALLDACERFVRSIADSDTAEAERGAIGYPGPEELLARLEGRA